MTQKERYERVTEWFEATMPAPQTELHFGDNYQLLTAVILSAQCTDKRVNMITPALFEKFPTVADMAAASVEEIYELIKSVSYPNNKAKSLKGMAMTLMEKHGGEVPGNMDELLEIPGVGRKTANVMLSVAFGQSAMAVDTHVFRVSERLGLTTGSKTPLETEKTLTRNFAPETLGRAHHWLILHGRYVCKARRPDCLNCGLTEACRYYQKGMK
ncbi:MAG: endonuclease III [Muribaculaceae bacterium]|nr:endonuclease III [Muribaculaceae bacterium]